MKNQKLTELQRYVQLMSEDKKLKHLHKKKNMIQEIGPYRMLFSLETQEIIRIFPRHVEIQVKEIDKLIELRIKELKNSVKL